MKLNYIEELYLYESFRIAEKKNHLKVLKENRKDVSPEERKKIKSLGGVWSNGDLAVWKSVDSKGNITWVTNTHRAYETAKSIDSIVNKFLTVIKETS